MGTVIGKVKSKKELTGLKKCRIQFYKYSVLTVERKTLLIPV